MPTGARIERICGRGLDARALRVALLDEIRATVPFDAHAWVLTDPETCVGSSPLADVPSLDDLPTLVRLKYLTPTNRWTSLAPGRPATLVDATGGDRSASPLWAGLLSGYGVDDVVSTVFRDRFGCWAFLDLWRNGGTFTARECSWLGELAAVVTPALRRCLVPTFAPDAGDSSGSDRHVGPVVLLLGDDLRPLTQTPETDAYLRALLPTDAGQDPVPAGAYNAAAQLLACEAGVDPHPPWARAHLRGGRWVTVRAARMDGPPALAAAAVARPAMAVTVEPTPPSERAELYARVVGLTDRETELLHNLIAGGDTRELARRLHVSEHTVQDHLKSVFAKSGANSRRALVACATGGR